MAVQNQAVSKITKECDQKSASVQDIIDLFYSASPSSLLIVGLCFSDFFFFSTTILPGGGVPTRSRANSLTAVTARNRFAFFFFVNLSL